MICKKIKDLLVDTVKTVIREDSATLKEKEHGTFLVRIILHKLKKRDYTAELYTVNLFNVWTVSLK